MKQDRKSRPTGSCFELDRSSARTSLRKKYRRSRKFAKKEKIEQDVSPNETRLYHDSP